MTDEISPRREQQDDLPPSCRFVLDVLAREGELTRQELLDETTLPESTLDDALRTLENRDRVLLARKTDDLTQVTAEIQD